MSSMNFPKLYNAQAIPAGKALSKDEAENLAAETARAEDGLFRIQKVRDEVRAQINTMVLLKLPPANLAALNGLSPTKAQLLGPYLDYPEMTVEKIAVLASAQFPESLLRALVEQQQFDVVLKANPDLLKQIPTWTVSDTDIIAKEVLTQVRLYQEPHPDAKR